MALYIPEAVRRTPWEEELLRYGHDELYRGKVRSTRELRMKDGKTRPRRKLVLVTDTMSAMDFVFRTPFFGKGENLLATMLAWVTIGPLRDERTHLVAYGADIDRYLERPLQGRPELRKVAAVVEWHRIPPVENIVRHCLTGSAVKPYNETGVVCGHHLPPGLRNGDIIPGGSIYAPSTKAKIGNDEHMAAMQVRQRWGAWLEEDSLRIHQKMHDYAITRGLRRADGKTEQARGVLCDEWGTGDSDRYWDEDERLRALAEGREPRSLCKEEFRRYIKPKLAELAAEMGVPKLDPANLEHAQRAAAIVIPQEVIDEVMGAYSTLFERLFGMTVNRFQRDVMHVYN